jgi:hypothetical protein
MSQTNPSFADTRVRIVETDNFAGDYPNESFLNAHVGNKASAQKIADALNEAQGPMGPRFFKVVVGPCELQGGFEP